MQSGDTLTLRARELLQDHDLEMLPSGETLTRSLRHLTKQDANHFIHALLEAALLVAAADGDLAKEELGTLADLLQGVTGSSTPPSTIVVLLEDFNQVLAREGRVARYQAIAEHVTDEVARKEIIGFACLMAMCDHDLAPAELFVLHSLGRAFGVKTKVVDNILKSVKVALGITDAPRV